jgi:hypothetical protein
VASIGSHLESVAIVATLYIDVCTLLHQHLSDLLVAFRGSSVERNPRVKIEVNCEDKIILSGVWDRVERIRKVRVATAIRERGEVA